MGGSGDIPVVAGGAAPGQAGSRSLWNCGVWELELRCRGCPPEFLGFNRAGAAGLLPALLGFNPTEGPDCPGAGRPFPAPLGLSSPPRDAWGVLRLQERQEFGSTGTPER